MIEGLSKNRETRVLDARSGSAAKWIVLGVVLVGAVLGAVYLFAQGERAQRIYERDLENGRTALSLADQTDLEVSRIEDPKERRSKRRIRDDYLAKSKESFQLARDQRPEDPEPHLGLGRVAYLAGRYNEAVEQFERVLELGDQSAITHFELGRSFARWFNEKSSQELIDKALIYLEEALMLDPDLLGAHEWLASIYTDPQYERTDTGKLRRHEDAVLRLAPDSPLAKIIRQEREGQ